MPEFFHLSVKMIGRSNGRSAVACAAYRAGQSLYDERYAQRHDYAPRRGILHAAILAPEGAPAWAFSREQLWNRVEAAEKRKDAQLAREITLGLPCQLAMEDRIALVETFIREQLLPRGMVVDYAIHAPGRAGDARNYHVHVMTTLRLLDGEEFAAKKDREACAPAMIHAWRTAWAEAQNRVFAERRMTDERGRPLHVDHRSYERQGIDREPTQHMGPLATAMERGGTPTEIGARNRAVQHTNDRRRALREQAHALERAEAELWAETLERPRSDDEPMPRRSVRSRGRGFAP